MQLKVAKRTGRCLMPVNEFRSIATFIQAAELGSLRQAALSQGLTPQAASKALAQLERHLGVRLFHRTTRSLALTEEGRRLLEATQPLMQGLEHALQNVQQSREAVANH
jgi:DNA-binding transcriptional LysR family regulator